MPQKTSETLYFFCIRRSGTVVAVVYAAMQLTKPVKVKYINGVGESRTSLTMEGLI